MQAVSYSAGLETSRPRTCLGLPPAAASPPTPAHVPVRDEEDRLRGKLDKSHSTPAYDFAPAEPALHPPIPESPPAPPDLPAGGDAPSVSLQHNLHYKLLTNISLLSMMMVCSSCSSILPKKPTRSSSSRSRPRRSERPCSSAAPLTTLSLASQV